VLLSDPAKLRHAALNLSPVDDDILVSLKGKVSAIEMEAHASQVAAFSVRTTPDSLEFALSRIPLRAGNPCGVSTVMG
jgi:hypothetical protein